MADPSITNTLPNKTKLSIKAQPLPDDLQQALEELDNPGDFHTGDQCTLPFPGLKVEGVPDTIALPLTPAQAEQLASVAKQSPHGRGMQTVIDTSIRDCFEIDPSNLTFTNGSWETDLQQVADKAIEELGMSTESVYINLYKLLLYKKGGHFTPHKDTQKEKGVFGTLTVQLPSLFGGGKFVVRHREDEMEYYNGADDGSCEDKFYYTAFFADVERELVSIDHGYRLVLVYNLNCADSGVFPCADETQLNVVKSEMVNLDDRSPAGTWILAFGLEQKYTVFSFSGLGVNALKREDRTKVVALKSGAQAANIYELEVLLVILQRIDHERGDGNDGYCNDSEVCDKNKGDIKIRAAFYANGCRCDLDLGFINWNGSLRDKLEFKVKEREEVEYTGNEGPARKTIYETAAVVLWPKSKEIEILGDNPANLSSLISHASVDLRDILDHALTVLENQTVQDNEVAWQQLQTIFDTSLTNKFIPQTRRAIDLAALINGPENVFPFHPKLIRAISYFGWEEMSTPMTKFLFLNMALEVYEIETRLDTLEAIRDCIPQNVLIPSVDFLFEFLTSKLSIAPYNVEENARVELWGMFLRQLDHIHNLLRDTKNVSQITSLISRLVSLCRSLDLKELDDVEMGLQQRGSIEKPDPLEMVSATVKQTLCSLLMKRFQSEVNHIAKTKSLPTSYDIPPESSSSEDWVPLITFFIRVLLLVSTEDMAQKSEETFQRFLSTIASLSEHSRNRLSVALSVEDENAAAAKIRIRIIRAVERAEDRVMEKALVEKVRSLAAATEMSSNDIDSLYTVHNLQGFPSVRSFLTSDRMEVTLRFNSVVTARKILASLRKELPNYIKGDASGIGWRSYIRLWKPFQYTDDLKALRKAKGELNAVRSRLLSSRPNSKRQRTV